MDKLDNHLRNTAVDEELHPAIHAAMKLARNKMDRYWKKTNDSNVYCIAMGRLCPVPSWFDLIQIFLLYSSPSSRFEAPVLPRAELG